MKAIRFAPALLLLAACSGSAPKYDATGTFEATEVLVSAEATGRLWQLDVEEGMTFSAGQQVGLIDTVQLGLKKRQLEAGARSVSEQRPDIGTQMAATRTQIAAAQRELHRTENLLAAGAANAKQLDDARDRLNLLQRQLAAQQSSLGNSDRSLTAQTQVADVQVAQVADQLRKCHITAPITGTVLAKYAEAGEWTVPGSPLFKMADVGKMYLRAYITSQQLAEVRLGQHVTVYSDYGDDRRKAYPGTITWISETSEFTPKTILTKDERAALVYAVKVQVKNDGLLKIGMYGGMTLQ
ncbi:MAG: HlyD family efflux transporter periplasmic adaptor subunit [Mediterranea sp.]|jgi:HlyD family secretion protein|nr:HlyD family efflux transporter periplasmic adaptor subunit [Mediterranea sp.]